MKNIYDIIVKPIITENSMNKLKEKKYTFKVAKETNKVEIKKAIEKIFGVKVVKVNTLNIRGRQKRVGKHTGFKPSWKKAIVSLTKDSKGIEFFEGMN